MKTEQTEQTEQKFTIDFAEGPGIDFSILDEITLKAEKEASDRKNNDRALQYLENPGNLELGELVYD